MTFHRLAPEVPGGLGARTRFDEPRAIVELHFEFAAGCRGDDLATSHPVFIVSERIAAVLDSERVTGFVLAAMEQSVEPQAYELDPDLDLPRFRWLQVTGQAGRDDIGLDRAELVVSERALDVLRRHAQLSACDVEPWAPGVP